MDAQELLKKGDLEIEFADGNVNIVVDTSAAKFSVSFKSSYLIDKLEEVIPGDQKGLALILKGALGI